MTDNQPTGQIIEEIRDGIMQVTINRPEKKNALTVAMYSALTEAIMRGEQDPAVKIILISGAGGNFTSGNDLQDFLDTPPRDMESPVFVFMNTISRAEKPIIAAVTGLAVGIGTTMLLHCDLVYAGSGARFLLPFVNLGLNPEAGSSFLLPLLAGYHRAAELLFLGEPFSADRAREIGLVNAVCDDSEVLNFAMAQAKKIIEKPQISVRLTKRMLKKGNAEIVGRLIPEEANILIKRLASPEADEAFRAFFERRKPDFTRFQ